MASSDIVIRGAREHNLRDVSLELPRGCLICFTGVSGSGKSSLAFDTLYAEGQRRYVESLSSYARQFLGQLPKPDVDRIDGLSPSISIQQKTGGRNPRSTVGTITEIHDHLRVLFARVGRQHCPSCGRPVAAQTREQIVARLLELPPGTNLMVLAPVVRGQKGEHRDRFAELSRAGYVRARVDGRLVTLSDPPSLDRQVKHDVEVVIDRVKLGPSSRSRLGEAVEAALRLGDETVIAAAEDQTDLVLSSRYACASCGIGFDAPSPQLFSFNSPQGMCASCDGLGVRHDFDPALLVPDPARSVWDGAIAPIGPVKKLGKWRRHLYEGFAANVEAADGLKAGTLLKTPWEGLTPEHRHAWLSGTGDRVIVYRWRNRGRHWSHAGTWAGIATELLEKYRGSQGGPHRAALEPYMRSLTCPECSGARLNARARSVLVGDRSLPGLESMDLGSLCRWFDALAGQGEGGGEGLPGPLDPLSRTIAEELLKEIRGRLRFLTDVGLDYLTLDRSAPTLSGGEAQRIRLASQVGAGLVGVLYILDEPSIGLHPRDNERLIATLERLRDIGNTVVVVEHDEDTMRAADLIVDFGPGPGVKGGQVVARGDLASVSGNPRSVTGQYLSGRKSIAVPERRRGPSDRALRVVGARQNNLKGVDVDLPIGRFVCVTGVSGSGKSSLVGDILRDSLARDLNGANTEPGLHDRIEGIEHLDKIIDIDQSPIGRTPRSNASTYIKLFDEIRDLYTKLPDAKTRGYKPGRFSFNVPGGRCEACEGNGSNKLEMDFLADVWVTCPVCEGRRFNRETLHCRFKGKSISDVLEMDVQEALEHFANVPKIGAMLRTLHDVGLDYLKLGQPSPTLSGGEAQRIKLARELVKKGTGKTLYVLDEPTTGLHFEDIRRLLDVLQGFVEQGNTVVVIEHNLDVIKTADWVIDLGPEGGSGGGTIVAQGTPEDVAAVPESHTGRSLSRILAGVPGLPSPSKNGKPRGKGGRGRSAAELKEISIEGASQHNLKGIDVRIPRNRMTVCSGPSGSGKSSLAMDTLYAEGQRRYVESLSSYARQFLSPLQKPKVERVTGLSPAISIEQKTTSKSPRSTVGTVTEIHDYLRILYARLGHMHCPGCGTPVGTQTSDEIVEKILHHPEGTRIFIMAPVDRKEGDDYALLWDDLRGSGFARVRVDGVSHSLDDPPTLNRRESHRVEVVVDRAIVRRSTRSRLADAVESALDLGRGVIHVARAGDEEDESRWPVRRFSQHRSCDGCGRSFEELSPHHFSFNSPLGWCPSCEGLGVQHGADPAALIPDGRKSLRGGAVVAWPSFDENPMFARTIDALAAGLGIDLDAPFDDLEARHRRMILHGSGPTWFDVPASADSPGFRFQYKGLFPALEEAGRLSYLYRAKLRGMVAEASCSTCMGGRLRDDAAAVRFKDFTIDQVGNWPLGRTHAFFKGLKLSGDERHIAGDLIREIRDRLKFLVDVGLDYLSLSRSAPTLSGGESQRIRLASQIGSGLTGVLYVLDEPTIGLHPRDNARLLGALTHLRDLGNTLVLVEHDREVIEAADHLVDFGPGSGDDGGRVTASGPPSKVRRSTKSLTGRYLGGKLGIPVPSNRRPCDGPSLVIRNARQHNLKGVDVAFPIGAVTVVTGVSGSGKSSLVEDILMKACAQHLHRAQVSPGRHDAIEGLDRLDKVIGVDQTPIGGTPNSTPATYTGAFDLMRDLFARLPESKIRGYGPGRFSFNVPGGRCEACEGAGQKRIEMHFLPDVWVSCDSCGGKRYTAETLAVTYRGKSIADVLEMKVDSALELFAAVPKLRRVLQTLHDVGLGYVPLGQAAPTLSGGEAQRIKLAAELSRPQTGRTLYVLDEPTTGLHADDVRKLLDVIHRLSDLGNTVVIIEHNLDVIKTADWVVDIGPEAGEAGGSVVSIGPPEVIASSKRSLTGAVLGPVLDAGPVADRPRFDPVAAARRELDEARKAAETLGESEAVAPPWESDGRRWHTRDRLTRTGKAARWDGRVLEFAIDRIAEVGGFPGPDWSKRTLVRVPGPASMDGAPPFLEASTGHEWVLTLRFRVPSGAGYAPSRIQESLGLEPFDRLPTPVLSDLPRVSLGFASPDYGEVVLAAHSAEELCTPEFEALIRGLADAYLGKGSADPWADSKARMRTLLGGSARR
ncbi:excinuclease ABC subunit UvrA [Tautonia plasticadhaerens]|uniref:UvrABC system protein A n=1 Tax=Tautonia plasticadhaerens TaxID=2527974 RepID=A0A518H775_9BACT|nr:excinuclease ABC subunit UvrA [Tautonia plasticadhaerens]QDV36719.1 UvrABC system protein A [Tautonia plasticadhaerens]